MNEDLRIQMEKTISDLEKHDLEIALEITRVLIEQMHDDDVLYKIVYVEDGKQKTYLNNTAFDKSSGEREIEKIKRDFPWREDVRLEKIIVKHDTKKSIKD